MPSHPPVPDFTPTLDYHWSRANQRAFLEHLAITGSVTQAARHVAMSARAAYDLRYRRDGAAFRLGWAAAVIIARGRLADDLLERAIHGHAEEYVRSAPDENGDVHIRRHRTDSKLGMEYLKRLDKMAQGTCENSDELHLAQIIMGDWQTFLECLAPAEADEVGGAQEDHLAAIAGFLRERENGVNPLSSLLQNPGEECEVTRFLEDFAGDDIQFCLPTIEQQAAEMSVWLCDDNGEWRTDFPPPVGFIGEESGPFGSLYYERELTDAEYELQEKRHDLEQLPLRRAAHIAHAAWFGLDWDGPYD